MTENRKVLEASDLDGFDKVKWCDLHSIFANAKLIIAIASTCYWCLFWKAIGCDWQRKFPSPGFQVEIVMIDYDGILPTKSKSDSSTKKSDGSSSCVSDSSGGIEANASRSKATQNEDNDDVFSDSEGEETGASNSQPHRASSKAEPAGFDHASKATPQQIEIIASGTDQMTLSSSKNHLQINDVQEPTVDGAKRTAAIGHVTPNLDSVGVNDIKAIAADASVFTFGDEEDFESEWESVWFSFDWKLHHKH